MCIVTCPTCSPSCRTWGHMASPSGVTRTISMAASIGPKPLEKRLQPTTCCCSSGHRRPRPRTSSNLNETRHWPCKKASYRACWIRRHSRQRLAPSTASMHVCRTRLSPRFCRPYNSRSHPPKQSRAPGSSLPWRESPPPTLPKSSRPPRLCLCSKVGTCKAASIRLRGTSTPRCTPACSSCQDLAGKMANVGGLPGGTAQPHHRSTRFADQDTGDLHKYVSDDGSATNCIGDDHG